MALHNVSPVREQLRGEILEALERGPLTTSDLYHLCPSADDPAEIARIAYEMKRKGLVADGCKVLHPLGRKVNSYVLASPTDPRLAIHLTTTAPQTAAEDLDEDETMSEDTPSYIPYPDTFTQEPREPESPENIDSDLVGALIEMAHLEPKDDAVDDAVMLASEYVGDMAAAPPKNCQCVRINRLPRLPQGYVYGGVKVLIDAQHDVGRLTLATLDDGGGPFLTLKSHGCLAFDAGDLAQIARVGEALIQIHKMGDKS